MLSPAPRAISPAPRVGEERLTLTVTPTLTLTLTLTPTRTLTPNPNRNPNPNPNPNQVVEERLLLGTLGTRNRTRRSLQLLSTTTG